CCTSSAYPASASSASLWSCTRGSMVSSTTCVTTASVCTKRRESVLTSALAHASRLDGSPERGKGRCSALTGWLPVPMNAVRLRPLRTGSDRHRTPHEASLGPDLAIADVVHAGRVREAGRLPEPVLLRVDRHLDRIRLRIGDGPDFGQVRLHGRARLELSRLHHG